MSQLGRMEIFTGGWSEAVTMPRTPVTASELVQVLNTRLKLTGMTQWRVEGIQRLKGVDETGCNWSEDVELSGPSEARTDSDVRQIIEETRSRYNLI